MGATRCTVTARVGALSTAALRPQVLARVLPRTDRTAAARIGQLPRTDAAADLRTTRLSSADRQLFARIAQQPQQQDGRRALAVAALHRFDTAVVPRTSALPASDERRFVRSVPLARHDRETRHVSRAAAARPDWSAPTRPVYTVPLPIILDALSGTYVPPPLPLVVDARGPQVRATISHQDQRSAGLRSRVPHVQRAPGDARRHPRHVYLPPIAYGLGDPRPSAPLVILPVPIDRVVIPSRRAYLMIHALSVVRLPDRTTLPVRSLSLSTDYTQWAWTITLDLIGQGAEALIAPNDGEPVQIEISINGATWVGIAETWGQPRRWGALTITRVKGRSLTGLLSGRYQRPQTYTETEARTIAQLAEDALPDGEGWTLDWSETADWLVPAQAWIYQDLSPIQAVSRLAAAAGALVAPDWQDKHLRIRPVWSVYPWNLTAGLEDLLIPSAAVTDASRRYQTPDQANVVHIYGGEVGGVQAQVSRTGSAADEAAAERFEALCTHADAARALGARVLSGLAQPASLASVTLPVDARADFPVADLGDLVRVDIDGGQSGPVTGISINVTASGNARQVRQTLNLGETRNDWVRLRSYTAQEARIYATVLADNGNGTVVVQTLNGGTLAVRGSASPGAKVWIRANRVEDTAPAMTLYNLIV